MRFAGWFGILVGFLMLGQWGFFLTTRQVPELQSEPWRIAFHFAAEFATAAGLIVGGAALLVKRPWARAVYQVALGMLLYSVIASQRCFAQQGQTMGTRWHVCFAVCPGADEQRKSDAIGTCRVLTCFSAFFDIIRERLPKHK